jgi:hypothetical protein
VASLESARAKLARAQFHLQQLQTEIDSDGKNQRYGIEFIHYQDTDELVACAKLPREVFIHYSILAGEIVHHAQSALEHAKYEFRRGKTFKKAFPPLEPNDKTDLRYVGKELWKREKHRFLNRCSFLPYGGTITYRRDRLTPPFPNTFEQRTFSFPEDVEDGAELFREPHPGPDVNVQFTLVYQGIVFRDEPAVDEFVPAILSSLVQFTESILDNLAASLAPCV